MNRQDAKNAKKSPLLYFLAFLASWRFDPDGARNPRRPAGYTEYRAAGWPRRDPPPYLDQRLFACPAPLNLRTNHVVAITVPVRLVDACLGHAGHTRSGRGKASDRVFFSLRPHPRHLARRLADRSQRRGRGEGGTSN